MNGPTPRVSVVIPCYNEQDNIQNCVQQVAEVLFAEQIPYEILVVNDGSSDGTIALKEGVRRARGDIVAFFDADLQYSAKDIVTMIARLGDKVDFVNGTRDYNGYGASRTAFSRLYNRVVRLLFRFQLRDSNCGIKVLRRKAADAETIFNYGLPLVVPLLKIRGFGSTEVPVMLHERTNGESKYFQDGQFLGGSKNIKDIVFHSMMLLNLLAHAPSEWSSRDRVSRTSPIS